MGAVFELACDVQSKLKRCGAVRCGAEITEAPS
jgi:hypothetical protein